MLVGYDAEEEERRERERETTARGYRATPAIGYAQYGGRLCTALREAMVLCSCYAMRSTERRYGALHCTEGGCDPATRSEREKVQPRASSASGHVRGMYCPTSLRAPYAMSGTSIAHVSDLLPVTWEVCPVLASCYLPMPYRPTCPLCHVQYLHIVCP
eukprot:3914249-Rhodomonas_salina.1